MIAQISDLGLVRKNHPLDDKVEKLEAKVEQLEKLTARHATCVTALIGIVLAKGIISDAELCACLTESETAVKAVVPTLPGLSG